mmetsp:Transcript_26627/g.44206  ORF Transcript_26627/g.44206 Transcript_26627/m.44206 type:complete len:351 (+) Transcript_26627:167-1219(+)|eukprot:CAMPEP_0119320538 /NCGR_PEP_ID=MMETSP1333-20130426/52732_1 /TAXON_ID=418940 /ORGANISM="Scyphosphaera apsteinii, Strain RCC1455" /LENGTH=350 /DNA_ID=CAMNT_0007327283 /DNA_START=164 /DNA_END=1216 /DNA_ORIENTATION=-
MDFGAQARQTIRADGRACGVVLNAIGAGLQPLAAASRLAMLLRHILREQPSACASFCLHLFLDSPQLKQLADSGLIRVATRIWDVISPYPSVPPVRNTNHAQGTPQMWLMRLASLLASREYDVLIFMDSDAFPCPGIERLISWFASSGLHVASAQPVVPHSGSFGLKARPEPMGGLQPSEKQAWLGFSERNLGFGMLARRKPQVGELLHRFEAEFIMHMNDTRIRVNADQSAWRSALFWAKVQRGSIKEQMLPQGQVCRMLHRSLHEHRARHGNASCGKCVVMHHKAVENYIRLPAWHAIPHVRTTDLRSLLHDLLKKSLRNRIVPLRCDVASRRVHDESLLSVVEDKSI